jgi:serine/threonine-protein kinase
MGIVVAATQVELDRPVALKFLLPRVLERPDLAARFSREARAAAKLQSEHVARVLDVGALKDGSPYMVMEYLDGQDLGKLVKDRGPLPVEEVVRYLLEAGEAVAEAHSLGIVHRDLKPSNLFLAKRGGGTSSVKVLDFGLSKFTVEGDPQLTSDSSILGSPLYMPPEQLLSARRVDPRSDIWSLGVVLYELLTAHPPFRSDRMPELITDILHSAPRPIERWRSDLPPHLVQVVRRCLEKDPVKRFESVAEMATALAGPSGQRMVGERFGSGRAPSIEPALGAEVLAETMANAGDEPFEHDSFGSAPAASQTIQPVPGVARPGSSQLRGRRRAAVVWVGVSFGTVALVAGATALRSAARPPPPREPASPVQAIVASDLAPPRPPAPPVQPPSEPPEPVPAADAAAAAETRPRPSVVPANSPIMQRAPNRASPRSAGSGAPSAAASQVVPPQVEDPLARLKAL